MGNENSSQNNAYWTQQQNLNNESYLIDSKKFGTFHHTTPNQDNFDDVSE